jgi:hypothetical protein
MSNSIPTIPIPIGNVHPMPASAPRDSNLDIGELQRRCEELIHERDGLKAALAKTQTERDGYLKTVYHFMCKDYVPPPFTKEEVFAHLDDKPSFEELIVELEREYVPEK